MNITIESTPPLLGLEHNIRFGLQTQASLIGDALSNGTTIDGVQTVEPGMVVLTLNGSVGLRETAMLLSSIVSSKLVGKYLPGTQLTWKIPSVGLLDRPLVSRFGSFLSASQIDPTSTPEMSESQ